MEKVANVEESHLVVDLETLDADPSANAAVVAIGVVVVSEAAVEIHSEIILIDAILTPGSRSKNTYEWWMKQNEAIRNDMLGGTVEPWRACDIFTGIVSKYEPTYIWGFPARFDVGHLRQMYVACGREFPMKFWQERDLSTLLWLARSSSNKMRDELKAIKAENPAAHDALADAKVQAKMLLHVLSNISA